MSCNCNGHCEKEKEESKLELILTIIGTVIFLIPIIFKIDGLLGLIIYILSYILIGYEIILNACKSLFKKTLLDENVLMVIATLGAFFIGEYTEGVAVLLFYKAGEFMQEKAVQKSRKSIEKAIAIKPEYANLKVAETIQRIEPKELSIGDIIVIKAGEKVPIDGEIIKGKSSLDVSMITGESSLKEVESGDEILSGSINVSGLLEVRVSKNFEDSTISRIVDLIENAASKKSRNREIYN